MQGLQDVVVALEQLWELFRIAVPKLLSAAVILLVGYAVGRIVGMAVGGLLRRFLGLDKWVRRKGFLEELYGLRPSGFLAGLIKWYIYLLFIGIAAENLGSGVLSDSARALVEYSPKLLASLFLMFLGLLAGGMIRRYVLESTLAGKEFFGSLFKFATVAIFSIAALSTAGVDVSLLVQTVVIAVAAVTVSLGVAVGIALGLVLKDELRPYIRSVLREILGGERDGESGEVESGLYPP